MHSKLFIVLFTSMFLFTACSSNPNRDSSSNLANIATGVLLTAALASAAKGDDDEDNNGNTPSDDDDDDKKKIGYALGGLLIGYVAYQTFKEDKEKERLEAKRKIELDNKRKREEKLRNRKGKNEYTPKELNQFFRDYASVSFNVTVHNKVNDIESQGDPLSFKITPIGGYIDEYKPTIIPTYPNGLYKNNCTHTKKEEDKVKHWKEMSLSDIGLGLVGHQRKAVTLTFNCNYNSNDIKRRVSYFRKLGIKNNSSLMRIAKKSKTQTVLKTTAVKMLDKPFGDPVPTYATRFSVDDDTRLFTTNVKELEITISSPTYSKVTKKMGKGFFSDEGITFYLPNGNYDVKASGIDGVGKSLFSFSTKINVGSNNKNCNVSLWTKIMRCSNF
jgi:hypothetical protein